MIYDNVSITNKIMYYRKFTRHGDEESSYSLRNRENLEYMFEKYINAYIEEKINKNKKDMYDVERYFILQNNWQLIERAFIYCCARNDFDELKHIYDMFINNTKIDTNKGAIKIFEKTLQHYLFIDIYEHCDYKIVEWIIAENILFQVDYDNLFERLSNEMYYESIDSLLNTLYKYNPNILTIKPVLGYFTSPFSDNVVIKVYFEKMYTLEKLFIHSIYNNIQLMRVLQTYRPFQFGSKFEVKMEQNEIKINYYKLNFIEEDGEDFDWEIFYKIKSEKDYKIDYKSIKKRMDYIPEGCEISLREGLIRNRFHPKYANKWIEWGLNISEDFE